MDADMRATRQRALDKIAHGLEKSVIQLAVDGFQKKYDDIRASESTIDRGELKTTTDINRLRAQALQLHKMYTDMAALYANALKMLS